MPLIPSCQQAGAEQSQYCIAEVTRAGKRHPPRAQPCESDKAVADKVASFADVVVDDIPARTADGPEDPLIEVPQRPRSVIGAEICCRFDRDNADADGDWEPRADPEAGVFAAEPRILA